MVRASNYLWWAGVFWVFSLALGIPALIIVVHHGFASYQLMFMLLLVGTGWFGGMAMGYMLRFRERIASVRVERSRVVMQEHADAMLRQLTQRLREQGIR